MPMPVSVTTGASSWMGRSATSLRLCPLMYQVMDGAISWMALPSAVKAVVALVVALVAANLVSGSSAE
ncbi:hypothetical protein D3C78_1494080 [compost metagenome]